MLRCFLGVALLAVVLSFGTIGIANAGTDNGKGNGGQNNGHGNGAQTVPELDPKLLVDGIAILAGFLLLMERRRPNQR